MSIEENTKLLIEAAEKGDAAAVQFFGTQIVQRLGVPGAQLFSGQPAQLYAVSSHPCGQRFCAVVDCAAVPHGTVHRVGGKRGLSGCSALCEGF